MRRRRGGVVRTVGRTAVIAGTASAVAGGVNRRQEGKAQAAQQKDAAAQQAAYDQGVADAQPAPPPPPAPAAPTGAEADTIGQLTKLGELRAQGILTDAEFEAQKAKVLAG
ncbi:MAG: SHOCT domain-containing protein [Ilumatobacter sp.]|nr:SHOCT domain-containing protein [Ilumatobacter sp.]